MFCLEYDKISKFLFEKKKNKKLKRLEFAFGQVKKCLLLVVPKYFNKTIYKHISNSNSKFTD